ncbi:MAG: thymidine phosphorylase [Myxococcota bacterium]
MSETLVDIIRAKRDGRALSGGQIRRFIAAHSAGELTDYQMTAFLMAVFFRGMSDGETVALTQAMLASGTTIDLSGIDRPKVDKHSTGGVGDKISICLAPLVAACGVAVPMISGRGLGHTGGTLDKLEAIPGFSVRQDIATFRRLVDEIGTCLIGQTAEVAPADKRIYALRDVSATVEAIPLIVASILSKKLAEGIDALVLDVKVGRGAFMGTLEEARVLAEALVKVGVGAGVRVSALLTDMSAPLGRTIGNAIETREAIDILHGVGPDDVREITLALGAEMLLQGGVVDTEPAGRARLEAAIASGDGARVLERVIEAQGGDPEVVRDPRRRLPAAEHVVAVPSAREGTVAGLDPLALGLIAVGMGAGRTRADQAVDPAVGIEIDAHVGDTVTVGQPLVQLHVRSREAAETLFDRVRAAYAWSDETSPASAAPTTPRACVLDRR